MAIRFNAAGQVLTGTLSLGSQSVRSYGFWGKISVDRNVPVTFFDVDGSGEDFFTTDSDGTSVQYLLNQAGVGGGSSVALTVGAWYYLGVSINGTTGTFYLRSESDSSWTTQSLTGLSAITCTTTRLGESWVTGDWLNGCLTAVKIWTGAALTQAEFDSERVSYSAARTANLAARYELKTASDLSDYSGGGHNLSGGSGTATESGPALLDAWAYGFDVRIGG